MTVVEVYDQESAFESAAKSLADAAGLVAFTPSILLVERPVPRLEIVFQLGDELEQHEIVNDNEVIVIAWRGTLVLQVVAPSDNYPILCEWRARTRNLVSHWHQDLAQLLLPNFDLGWVKAQGSSSAFPTDKGNISTTMRYTVSFSLMPGVVTELNLVPQVQPLKGPGVKHP